MTTAIPIIVGHHGYVVLVEDHLERARLVRSDHRGIVDVPGGDMPYAEADRETAVSVAVQMALRLNDTRAEEIRSALNFIEAQEG